MQRKFRYFFPPHDASCCIVYWGWQISCKGPHDKYFRLSAHMVSDGTVELCYEAKADIDNFLNEWMWLSSIKFYLPKQTVAQICLVGHSLLTPVVYPSPWNCGILLLFSFRGQLISFNGVSRRILKVRMYSVQLDNYLQNTSDSETRSDVEIMSL